MLNLNHKAKRDLLTGMDYVRDNSLITQRQYNYDALGRPVTRDTRYPKKAIHHNDTFAYDKRSQLVGALLGEDAYTYAYDNIGNREIAQEVAEGITYAANDLNQYTRISTNGENFTPEYDADGNQTLVQTTTGIWYITYNGQNRAIKFESGDGRTIITCDYDYMGRRFEKKVVTNGTTTLHERYIYRGYLQIAAYDLREGHAEHPDLRFIIWDPTQEVATRPLAIRENGVWYTYGWDLIKNICELYGQEGFIRTIYTYSPCGQVTAEGDISQPIQWSSEYHDVETGLVYYNFRYYNPRDGRWTRRDPLFDDPQYVYCKNCMTRLIDVDGLIPTNTIDGAIEEAIISGNIRHLEELLELVRATLSAQRAGEVAKALAKLKAEKARYGNCTKQQHHQLHSQVGKKCKGPRFSCKKCDDCGIIRENMDKASECIEARKAINDTCFNGGDAAHIAEVVKTETAMANCQNLARQLNCK